MLLRVVSYLSMVWMLVYRDLVEGVRPPQSVVVTVLILFSLRVLYVGVQSVGLLLEVLNLLHVLPAEMLLVEGTMSVTGVLNLGNMCLSMLLVFRQRLGW